MLSAVQAELLGEAGAWHCLRLVLSWGREEGELNDSFRREEHGCLALGFGCRVSLQ